MKILKYIFTIFLPLAISFSVFAEVESPNLIEKSLDAVGEGIEDGLDTLEDESSLLFRLGYPYTVVQNNSNFHSESFPAFFAGVELKIRLSRNNFLALLTEFSYTDNYKDFELELDDKQLVGDSSIRLNAFSLSFYQRLKNIKLFNKGVYVSLGPTVAQTTLKFDNVKSNNTNVKPSNKVTLRQYGLRASLMLKKIYKNIDLEFIYYYLKRSGFSVVEDSSLDTNVISQQSESSQTTNHGIVIAIRSRIF